MSGSAVFKNALASALVLGCVVTAQAQPAGWSTAQPITVTENSGAALTGYQLRLVLDTSAIAPNAADLRFGTDLAGTTLLDYWVESGAGTASTVVWVRLPALPASGQTVIYMYSGNPGASSASTVAVFDHVSALDNSATNQISGGLENAPASNQRGFRFSPNQDILVTEFGKNEPEGTTRYITLFDFASQAILRQQQVTGPAATYSYQPLTNPIWLTAGTQYLLQMHQANERYYYQTSSQINPMLTYYDMRFCNSCDQNTFPTSVLSGYQYGYPDFQFRTRQNVAPAPTWAWGAAAGGSGLAAVPVLGSWSLPLLATLMAGLGALGRRRRSAAQ